MGLQCTDIVQWVGGSENFQKLLTSCMNGPLGNELIYSSMSWRGQEVVVAAHSEAKCVGIKCMQCM